MAEIQSIYRGTPHARPGGAVLFGYVAGKELDFNLPVRVELNADGVTVPTIDRWVLTFKRLSTDTDPQAILQREGSVATQPTVANKRRGRVKLTLSKVDTAALGIAPYYFEATAYLSNGRTQTIESGQAILTEGITDVGGAGTLTDHIDVTPSSIGVVQGSPQQFTATPRDNANNALAGRKVTWFTQDPSVGTIDQVTGLFQAIAEGIIRVFACAEEVCGSAEVTVSIDDVALLIANTGGNTRWPAFYDARRNVRHISNAVHVWDDARCSTATGRVYVPDQFPILATSNEARNATKGTMVAWYQGCHHATLYNGSFGFYFDGVEYVHTLLDPGGITLYVGAGLANYGSFTLPANTYGTNIMLAVVFDGAGATNADRLKCYYRLYDKVTATWGSLVTAALTYTGTIPAAIPAAGGSDTIQVNNFPSGGSSMRGLVDELRWWTGIALSQAQVDTQTLTSDPNSAHHRWTFNGNGDDTGSVGGLTLAPSSGSLMFASDDIRWGDPITAKPGINPTFDPVNFTVTSDGTDDLASATGAALRRITGDCGVFVVSTWPTWGGTTEYWFQLAHITNGNGLPASLAAYTFDAGGNVFCFAESGAPGQSVPRETGRRLVQFRRQRAGGDVTIGVKKGSAAETTATAAEADTTPSRLMLGCRPDEVGKTDSVWRAFVVRQGDYLPAIQDAIQDWSVLRHATPA
jgi:hypothetical protein